MLEYEDYLCPSIVFPVPLPGRILDQLHNVPKAGEGINGYIFRSAINLLPYRSDDAIFEILRHTTRNSERYIPDREILQCYIQWQNICPRG